MSGVCVETLCEIAIHDPKTVALAGGYASVVRAVLYGDAGDDSVIASVFHVLLYLYNLPCTRRYLTDELELCLAAFTDTGYYMTLPNVAKLKRHEKSKTEEPIGMY
ncbi:hypothetical protein SARC_17884 [Sphaeroforma arctica JP610]|uniref:Rapamycin-insensitive companion of mTOR N-terminal domain-containing protein n=1 Tax=Sphaeroforma arctica JP610 TaxID=667725 RepID=A0A0L0F0E5_9EUKA|nr:hypothetical protein SARC_17884 [Sphaeroforma arctica JP610]KNC69603.1 hypothetical protein SARC_17884 [Sphaeroforma arctica JP610]|eukprot:XP_014143505.1 hypothetical protein SARC_17884 [Sphaeroforma arctica JP610]